MLRGEDSGKRGKIVFIFAPYLSFVQMNIELPFLYMGQDFFQVFFFWRPFLDILGGSTDIVKESKGLFNFLPFLL